MATKRGRSRKKRTGNAPRLRQGQEFGRDRDSAPGGLTDLGCPDCRGVLAVQEIGDGGHLSFECRVGHAFSSESLVAAKEEQLETALWTVVELFEEMNMLHNDLAARARDSGGQELARRFTA